MSRFLPSGALGAPRPSTWCVCLPHLDEDESFPRLSLTEVCEKKYATQGCISEECAGGSTEAKADWTCESCRAKDLNPVSFAPFLHGLEASSRSLAVFFIHTCTHHLRFYNARARLGQSANFCQHTPSTCCALLPRRLPHRCVVQPARSWRGRKPWKVDEMCLQICTACPAGGPLRALRKTGPNR
jgi:hypothetical protein